MTSTMLRSTARKGSSVIILLMSTLVLCALNLLPVAQIIPSAAAEETTSSQPDFSIPETANVNSWQKVADKLAQDLNAGAKALNSGDQATAASHFQRAYNMDYIASNFATVLRDRNQKTAKTLDRELSSLTTDVYNSTKPSSFASRVAAIITKARTAASGLDTQKDLKNPRDYAIELAKTTQADRKKLDAAKTRKNNGKGSRTWTDVAQEMVDILNQAQKAATTDKDDRKGSDLVNHAYYQYYEKLGFEKTVMSAISADRVSQVENQFKESRKSMIGGKSDQEVIKNVADLKNMLTTDAKALDNGAADQVNPFITFVTSSFGQAFVILLREGLEAILVVAAIVSYLVKSGEKKKLKYIYAGVVLGLVASGIMALLLMFVYSSAQGSGQELFEGITALVAMVMLMYTSNWMLGKSGNHAWQHFIDNKTKQSLSNGSVFSLALLSFLAVFREGAETVIFYQALASMTSDNDFSPLWWGALAAVAVLIVVFTLFRVLSVRIPYKEFFTVMSIIVAILVVTFAGSGLHELIEADVINGTYIPSWPTNDFLGIYPYVQTVVFQIIIALIVIAMLATTFVRERRASRAAEMTMSQHDSTNTVQSTPQDLPELHK